MCEKKLGPGTHARIAGLKRFYSAHGGVLEIYPMLYYCYLFVNNGIWRFQP